MYFGWSFYRNRLDLENRLGWVLNDLSAAVDWFRRRSGILTWNAHYWTIVPHALPRILRLKAPPSVPWAGKVMDPVAGSVNLSGRLRRKTGEGTLLLVVHGLGGHDSSV